MAASLGELVVKISATADRFKADMKVAGGALDKFKAVASVASEAFGMLSERFDAIDDIGDFAQQVGVSVEELTGLRFAAEQAGSSAEAADAGLQKMVTTIGQAQAGSKKAVEAFEQFGLNIADIAKESPGEAFKQIADKIAELPSVTQQAAAAVSIFGKNGAQLMNVLREGGDGIDSFIERGKEVGAVLTNDAAAKAGEASDAIKELKTAWEGLTNNLLAEVAPAITAVTKLLTEVTIGAGKAIHGLADFALNDSFWGRTNFQSERAEAEQMARDRQAKAAADAFALQEAQAKEAEELAKKVAKESEQRAKEQAKAEEKAAKDAQEAREEIAKRGAQLAESLRNPQEIYNDTLRDTLKLLSVGAIDFATFERAAKQASFALDQASEAKQKALSIQATPGVGALDARSTAGFSAVQSSFRGQDALTRMAAEQARLEKEQLASQRRVEAALREGQRAIKEAVDKNTVAVEKMARSQAGGGAMPPPPL